MAPSFSRSIRDRTRAYVLGDLTLNDFKDWLVGATWNVERDHPEAADLTYEIKLLLAEHSRGDLAEPDLRAHLQTLVGNPVLVAP